MTARSGSASTSVRAGWGHKIASHYTNRSGGKNGIDVALAVLDANSDLGREYLTNMDLAGLYAYAGREWVVHTTVQDFLKVSIPTRSTIIITMNGKRKSAVQITACPQRSN